VYGCNSKACKNDTVRFYNFPKKHQSVVKIVNKFNEEELIDRHAAWIKVLKIGKKVTPSMRVCSLHFTPQDFIPSRKYNITYLLPKFYYQKNLKLYNIKKYLILSYII